MAFAERTLELYVCRNIEIKKYLQTSVKGIAWFACRTKSNQMQGSMTVAQAIEHIRRVGVDKETINTCYITGRTHKLKGVISIRSLILADPDALCQDLMTPTVVSVNTLEDQETVAQMFSKYNFNALPVVDGDTRLLGIVTMDDAMDIMEEEATEDMEKMAAMTPSDRPYLSTGVDSTMRASQWRGLMRRTLSAMNTRGQASFLERLLAAIEQFIR